MSVKNTDSDRIKQISLITAGTGIGILSAMELYKAIRDSVREVKWRFKADTDNQDQFESWSKVTSQLLTGQSHAFPTKFITDRELRPGLLDYGFLDYIRKRGLIVLDYQEFNKTVSSSIMSKTVKLKTPFILLAVRKLDLETEQYIKNQLDSTIQMMTTLFSFPDMTSFFCPEIRRVFWAWESEKTFKTGVQYSSTEDCSDNHYNYTWLGQKKQDLIRISNVPDNFDLILLWIPAEQWSVRTNLLDYILEQKIKQLETSTKMEL